VDVWSYLLLAEDVDTTFETDLNIAFDVPPSPGAEVAPEPKPEPKLIQSKYCDKTKAKKITKKL